MMQATGDDWLAAALPALHGIDAAGHEEIVTEVVRELTGRTPRSLLDFARDHADVLARLATPSV